MTNENGQYALQCAFFAGTLGLVILIPAAAFLRSWIPLIIVTIVLLVLIWGVRLAVAFAHGLGWTYPPVWHQDAAEKASLAILIALGLSLLMQNVVWRKIKRNAANTTE